MCLKAVTKENWQKFFSKWLSTNFAYLLPGPRMTFKTATIGQVLMKKFHAKI
jgi:hypothetical protein